MPTLQVITSELTWPMVSYSARPAVTEPPGVLMYRYCAFLSSSESAKSMTAMIWLTIRSSMVSPRKMMRSRYSRL